MRGVGGQGYCAWGGGGPVLGALLYFDCWFACVERAIDRRFYFFSLIGAMCSAMDCSSHYRDGRLDCQVHVQMHVLPPGHNASTCLVALIGTALAQRLVHIAVIVTMYASASGRVLCCTMIGQR